MSQDFLKLFGETITVIIGFSIFYLVLQRFAWGPILNILDERQKKIQAGFDEVKKLQADAAAAHARYEEKLRDIEAEARTKIQEAVAEGKRVAEEITEGARREAQDVVDKARRNLQLEVDTARKQLREDVIELTLMATGKLLDEHLTEARDRQLVESFLGTVEKG
jgi:F-type H+-transporting ATPase subunit b